MQIQQNSFKTANIKVEGDQQIKNTNGTQK
jgi:hypothetical protein